MDEAPARPHRLARLKRVGRAIVPQRGPEPTRDLVAETRTQAANQRSFVAALALYLPVIGIVAVALNLAVQTRGFQSLALTIIGNLPLSTLALTITTNLLQWLLIAASVIPSRITSDRGFGPSIRRTALTFQILAILLSLFTLSWPLALLTVVLAYGSWRFRLYVPEPREVSLEDWFRLPPVPDDTELRAIWLEGRQWMAANDLNVPDLPGYPVEADEAARSIHDLHPFLTKRQARISAANPRTGGQAAAVAITLAITLYGFNAVFGSVQFAPLERVTYTGGKPAVGYVFDGGNGDGVFVDRKMTGATDLSTHPIVKRDLCRTSAGFGPLIAINSRRRGVDCS